MRRTAALRLVPVALTAWAAAGLAVLLPHAAAWIALLLWLVALGAAAGVTAGNSRRRGTPRTRMPRLRVAVVVLVLAAAAAAGAASHVAFAQPARERVAELALEGGRTVEVDADVIGKIERRADGSLAFDAMATRFTVGEHGERLRADVAVQVSPADVDRLDLLDVGSRVLVRGTATPAHAGERAIVTVWGTEVSVRSGPAGIESATAALRRGLVAATSGLPGDGADLVPGLAVGDTSAVAPALDAAMKESSLSHLTAVSGANCAVVVGIAFALAAWAGGSRGVRVAVGLVALGGFIVLVTPEPSVVRAGAMAAIAMVALVLGRPAAGMSILSLAVTALLVADPWLATSLGFALSAVATASLLLLTRTLTAGLERVLPRPLALALAVPLAAQLACGPLLVLVTPTVPVFGVVANLLAAPAAPVATVVGLASCLAAPLPWLQSGLAAIAWVPASWIAATASTISELPANSVPWFEGWPGVACLALLGGAVVVAIVPPRAAGRSRPTLGLARRASIVLLALVAGAALGFGTLTTVAARWTVPTAWAVLACDVGQGDAVLVRSAGMVALVDTGPEPEALSTCLSRAGIDRIDLLVLTHFDSDHVGGVDAVTGRVGTVLHGPADASGLRVLESLTLGGAVLRDATEGMGGSLGDARWRVLWPRAQSAAYPEGNDASVVVEIEGGGVPRTLLLGDLSASPQRAVAASGLVRSVDVVKVAHHGSADQDPGLYALADAAVGIVTVGAGNDYGHPRQEILDVLEKGGARVARTDREGMVAIWRDGDALRVWREREGVDASG